MMAGEFGITGCGSGSSNEGVSSAMIGMGGFKRRNWTRDMGTQWRVSGHAVRVGYCIITVLIYRTGKNTKLSGYVHVF